VFSVGFFLARDKGRFSTTTATRRKMSASMAASARARLVPDHTSEPLPRLETGVVIALCAVKLLLHGFTSLRHYSYFRDELYYLDMARHLDWGYVDAAPLVAVYAKLALWLGGSLAALRILPAIAGTSSCSRS
jgi:hypothetical protein